MKRFFSALLLLCIIHVTQAQTLVSRTLIRSFSKSQLDSVLGANGIPSLFVTTQYGVDVYKVTYNSFDFDSSSVIESGLLAIPQNVGCKLPIVSYQHGSMSRKEDAPSRLNGAEPLISCILASNGYVGCAPDYIGLGDCPGIHRYQHALTEAMSVIDLIRAARESCDSLGVKLNGQIFLGGYSEGGHATMAAFKTIQEKLDNEIHVTAAAPMSGAYDMSGVMVDVMLSNNTYPSPSYLAYLVASWNPVYHMYDSLSKPLLAPYDSLLPIWFDGTHGLGYIDGQMPGVPKLIFKPDTVTAFANDTNHVFRRALRDNDLWNWVPQSPVRMLFCGNDHYVSPDNARVAYQRMVANGCTLCDTMNVNPNYDHQECAQFAILGAKFFMDSFAVIDCSNSVEELNWTNTSIYPNPATQQVTVRNLPVEVNSIKIIAADGQLVYEAKPTTHLQVANLPAGVYTLLLIAVDGKQKSLRFIKQ